MQVETIEIEYLTKDPANVRKHSGRNLEAIKGSLLRFGQQKPIVVNGDGIVVAGNGTLAAARDLGWTRIDVVQTDLKNTEATAFAIADNRSSELAEWDDDALVQQLNALQLEDEALLDAAGFSDAELTALVDEVTGITEGNTDPDEVPEVPEEPTAQPGQIWQLGNHRLMCGDSTSAEDVAALMCGQKADMVFTSPPYNVGKTPNGNESKYIDLVDNISPEDYRELLNSFVSLSLEYCSYVFCNIQSVAGNKRALISHLYDMRDFFADTIIWDKQSAEPAMAERVLNSRFEYIHIFSKEAKRTIGTRRFRGTMENVFELNSRKGKEFAAIHKATFRVELPLYFVENFSTESIYDPFCGSGTTIIACEQLGRKCYGMELSPAYCDVIIKRWEDFTGQTAELVNG